MAAAPPPVDLVPAHWLVWVSPAAALPCRHDRSTDLRSPPSGGGWHHPWGHETACGKAMKVVALICFFLQRFFVNKTELIEHIANQADISKAAAGRALEALIGGVRTTLKKGGTVSLVGFGSFAVTKRAARAGRNPRTGAAIKIKSAKIPKFRPGKALKDALN